MKAFSSLRALGTLGSTLSAPKAGALCLSLIGLMLLCGPSDRARAAESPQSEQVAEATLEGQVIEAQKQVDLAEKEVQVAEKNGESTMSPEGKEQWEQAEAELNGLVLESKEQQRVVKKKEHAVTKARLVYEKTQKPEDKEKLDQASNDSEKSKKTAVLLNERIAKKQTETEKLKRKAMSTEARRTLEKAEHKLVEAKRKLEEAKTRLAKVRHHQRGGESVVTGGDEPRRGGMREIQMTSSHENEEWFTANELELQGFGIYAVGDAQHTVTRERDIKKTGTLQTEDGDVLVDEIQTVKCFEDVGPFSDHAFGAGIGANYFITRYFGVGVEGQWLSADHNAWLAAGSLIARYPIEGKVHVAPYVFAGGGGQWADDSRGIGFVGGGIQARLTPALGAFADGRWLFGDHGESVAEIRAGFSWALGHLNPPVGSLPNSSK